MVRRYWKFLVPATVVLGVLIVLLATLSSNLVYFHTPTELLTEVEPSDDRLRLGGQVVSGTVAEKGETLLLKLTVRTLAHYQDYLVPVGAIQFIDDHNQRIGLQTLGSRRRSSMLV